MSCSPNTAGDGAGAGAGAGAEPGPEPDSSFGHGLVYNPLDPYNMYPHHETGEEVYGPPPLFGINKHDPFNMKPFNPNAFSGLFGQPPVSTLPPTIGPNPFTPLLQPMAPSLPMAPGVPTLQTGVPAPPMAVAPAQQVNPLLMAAALNSLTKDDSSFTPGQDPSSSSAPGADPSSSYYYTDPYTGLVSWNPSWNPWNPWNPYVVNPVVPQNPHPTDPNNQYPHPYTGSLTQPGPALAGGYNAYDPHNVIGAPPVFSERERALEHNRAAAQAQSPYAPYRMHQVPIP